MTIGPEPISKIDLMFLFLGMLLVIWFTKINIVWVQKKALHLSNAFKILTIVNHYFLCLKSEDTDNLFLPLALRRAKTFLPLAEAILSLKPCLFLLFLFDG
ncbi:hypothetical protein GCM10011444_22310 [Winogradskyella haliclonae]|uniref:Uncharacterized protein n=1 Tax=Winogradskyella haliclonae TaxID=2048558 RepID=A0ABQ2C1H5_9FLAO|nr:hypothetical protein GCM10011444_22310 [Winogradskyella haliclonae]